jgi:hypothetical protein
VLRVFDVIVMSRPDADTDSLHNRAIESGLFESGRPVLLAPPIAPKQIAINIMIHWNGSTEQARAIALAMPLLRQAKRVTVLTVIGGQNVPGPSADQVRKHLRYNGMPQSPWTFNWKAAALVKRCSLRPRRKAAICWLREPSQGTGCGK